jgi:SAM-dependent methyltransferase
MLNKIIEYAKKPALYEESTSKFWDDEHISKSMLEAHLNPDFEGASRNFAFMDSSAKWISEIVPSTSYKKLLDLGCGPGLYEERLAEKGYALTGIDFSKRSIEYAKQKAAEKGYPIEYIYQNYMEIDYENEFDVVILIYCDFGVLTHSNQEILLKKIHRALKSGGKFIFDVWTPHFFEGNHERHTWSINEVGGFWKPDAHLCLESHFIYEDNVSLAQFIVVDKQNQVNAYRVWEHYYTNDTLTAMLNKAGFEKIQFFSDVTGKPYDEQYESMCVVVEK